MAKTVKIKKTFSYTPRLNRARGKVTIKKGAGVRKGSRVYMAAKRRGAV